MADDRTDPQYKLRFSAELRDRIAEAAKAANRSINAEIVSRLEWSFTAPQIENPINRSTRPLTEKEYQRHIKAIVEVSQADIDDLMKEIKALRFELAGHVTQNDPEGSN